MYIIVPVGKGLSPYRIQKIDNDQIATLNCQAVRSPASTTSYLVIYLINLLHIQPTHEPKLGVRYHGGTDWQMYVVQSRVSPISSGPIHPVRGLFLHCHRNKIVNSSFSTAHVGFPTVLGFTSEEHRFTVASTRSLRCRTASTGAAC